MLGYRLTTPAKIALIITATLIVLILPALLPKTEKKTTNETLTSNITNNTALSNNTTTFEQQPGPGLTCISVNGICIKRMSSNDTCASINPNYPNEYPSNLGCENTCCTR